MPERKRSEYSAEDLANIDKFVKEGVNSIERKPFKPSLMLLGLTLTVIILGGLSLLIGYLVEPYL